MPLSWSPTSWTDTIEAGKSARSFRATLSGLVAPRYANIAVIGTAPWLTLSVPAIYAADAVPQLTYTINATSLTAASYSATIRATDDLGTQTADLAIALTVADTDTDPFTQVYNAIWTELLAEPFIAAQVAAGNRIKFAGITTNSRSPDKDNVASKDFPELRIVPTEGTPKLHASSNSANVSQRYSVQICSGDQRLDQVYFPLKWAVVRALSKWIKSGRALRELTWNAATFVRDVQLEQMPDGVREADANRGIFQWSTAAAIRVDMWFASVDL